MMSNKILLTKLSYLLIKALIMSILFITKIYKYSDYKVAF